MLAFGRWLGLAVRLVLGAAGLVVASARAEAPFSFDGTPGQLPKTVVPHHYAIRLETDLSNSADRTNFTTRGTVTVALEVRSPVREILFNALDLTVTKAVLRSPAPRQLTPEAVEGKQVVRLALDTELAPGRYELALEFTGKITEQAQGLFYVRYATPGGKKVMLGTQMEPTDARRMIPCWDEPVFRATFDLAVVVPAAHRAFSNLPITSEINLPGGLKEVRFARTPAMASYLLAFVSGELETIEDQAEGVQIRVVTTAGKQEQGRYALESTKQLLAYYNRYFGIRYPLPKLDQIAIPGGFSGAMENWGAITYNESLLLLNPQTSSQHTRQELFTTVAHEMAHQWFGDLVTTAWWDNLWLNEGFATWMESKAADHFNPEWQMWLAAGTDKAGVMSADARGTTHPIQQAVANESQANDAFDSITYQKGGALLRMLETYLGEEVFRQGVQAYLSNHLNGNATTADLWNALEGASHQPIGRLCAGWTEQPGLPLVRLQTFTTNGLHFLRLAQERFVIQDPAATPLQWSIPVALTDLAHPHAGTRFVLLDTAEKTVPFGDARSVIKANAGDVGYYRVAYDPAVLARLRQSYPKLPAADRLNLLGDAWAAVEAGRGHAPDYLALLPSLAGEKTYAIWDQVLGNLEFLDALERGRPGRAAWQAWAVGCLQPQLRRLGWEKHRGEHPNTGLLRTRLITTLGAFGDAAVRREALARFARFITRPDSLPADLRPAVIHLAGRYGDAAVHAQIHALARAAEGSEDRQLYYAGLASTVDPVLARRTLEISLTSETVPQEATSLVISVAQLGEQPELAWEFARANMTALLAKLESFDRNNYVPSIMRAFATTERADELEAYVKANVAEDAVGKAHEAAAVIRLKAALAERELPGLDAWIATRKSQF